MKTIRLLSIFLATGTLGLAACGDKDSGETTSTTVANDEAEAEESTTDGGNVDFAEEDTSTDGGGSTSSSGFIPETDMAIASSCDPWAQDCMEGEKCVAYASAGGTWDANKCVPVTGDGTVGEPCMYAGAVESTDDCDANSWCWDVNEEGVGVCTPFCTGSADSPVCEPGSSCSIANNGSINLCLTSCDPLLQDCGEGQACFYDGNGFVCANATQDIPTGEPCGFINDCAAGNICLAPESFPSCAGASCCGAFCDLSNPVCSLAGTECTAFYEEGMAPPGYEDVGVCVLPG